MLSALRPGPLESFIGQIESRLNKVPEEPTGVVNLDEVLHELQQWNPERVDEYGDWMAVLDHSPLPDNWTDRERYLLGEQLGSRLHTRQWLEQLIARPDPKRITLEYAHRLLMDLLHGRDPGEFQLSVDHVQGQIKTLQGVDGTTKLLENVQLLEQSRQFLRAIHSDRLLLYNTTIEQVAETLAQVDNQLMQYYVYLEQEMFSDQAYAQELQETINRQPAASAPNPISKEVHEFVALNQKSPLYSKTQVYKIAQWLKAFDYELPAEPCETLIWALLGFQDELIKKHPKLVPAYAECLKPLTQGCGLDPMIPLPSRVRQVMAKSLDQLESALQTTLSDLVDFCDFTKPHAKAAEPEIDFSTTNGAELRDLRAKEMRPAKIAAIDRALYLHDQPAPSIPTDLLLRWVDDPAYRALVKWKERVPSIEILIEYSKKSMKGLKKAFSKNKLEIAFLVYQDYCAQGSGRHDSAPLISFGQWLSQTLTKQCHLEAVQYGVTYVQAAQANRAIYALLWAAGVDPDRLLFAPFQDLYAEFKIK